MKTRNRFPITGAVLLLPLWLAFAAEAGAANPTYYDSLVNFQADIQFSVTDDYANPGYGFINSDAVMSSVLGETEYMSTGFMNLNIVSGATYCAGCNGSFQLSFLTTSVGTDEGVVGVGMSVLSHDLMNPYYAYITFGDGDVQEVQLPAGGSFWGVTAPERIQSIHFGLTGGVATTGGYFQIDDLIVGDGMDLTPCGDGITTPDEDCDDAGETALCDANCTFASCGDDTLNVTAGEECDDGPASITCNADCTLSVCGDGVVNAAAGETCDEMGETPTCNADCTAPMCGDGVPNTLAGEECDDGVTSPDCDADCTLPVCGDGYENNVAGEYCDDGNNLDGDGCSAICENEPPPATTGAESSGGGSSSGDSGGSSSGAADDSSGGIATTDDGGSSSGSGDGGSASASASGGDTTGGAEAGGSTGGADEGSSSGAPMDDGGSGCSCRADAPGGGRGSLAWLVLGFAALRRRAAGRGGPSIP